MNSLFMCGLGRDMISTLRNIDIINAITECKSNILQEVQQKFHSRITEIFWVVQDNAQKHMNIAIWTQFRSLKSCKGIIGQC